jgi:hypothetical protein
MNKIALPVVLLLSVFAWAEPNPSDYPISVHVNSAQVLSVTSAFGKGLVIQSLHVVINGKKFVLEAETQGGHALLVLVDYKAKLVEDKHTSTYESSQTYEFLFPDKTTKKFIVTGQCE